MEPLQQYLIHKAVEKLHFLRCVIQYILYDIFEHILSKLHVILQIGKRHFRLNHPEFRRMARSIGIFRTESRPKRIYIAERHCKCFRGKLAADGQVCGLAKEILGKVHLAILCAGQVFQIQRRHAEHFARAFRIAAGDDRRMRINKTPLLKELVNGIRNQAAHAEHRRKHICPRAQICNLAQKFHAVPLLLQRIIRRGRAFHSDFCRLDFKGLLRLRCFHQKTFYDNRRTNAQLCHLIIIRQLLRLKYNLHIFEK